MQKAKCLLSLQYCICPGKLSPDNVHDLKYVVFFFPIRVFTVSFQINESKQLVLPVYLPQTRYMSAILHVLMPMPY